MGSIGTAISRFTGKAPSRRVEDLLGICLLPGEPILAALQGKLRNQTSWLLLTESVVICVRDGMSTTIEFQLSLADITGFQAIPTWSGEDFELTTTVGSVGLSQVKSTSLSGFIHGAQQAIENLGPLGVPVPAQLTFTHILDLEAHITELLTDRGVAASTGDTSPLELALNEVATPLARCVPLLEAEGYPCLLLLWLFSALDGIDEPRLPATHLFWAEAHESRDEFPLLTVLDSQASPASDLWAAVLASCASALEAGAYVTQSQQSRAALLDRAGIYRARIKDLSPRSSDEASAQMTKSDGAGSPSASLLESLERLSGLLQAGAIDEHEFTRIKASILRDL